MSLFGSLFTGVSGLAAQSRAMSVISDNVANVSTVGYKGGISNFATLVTGSHEHNTSGGGGVQQTSQLLVGKQGILQSTGSATDAAISGNGFFVVSANADGTGSPLYTRAGSFNPDVNGNLRNANGFYLQGWKLDANEQPLDINATRPVNVRDLNVTTIPTSKIKLGANLDSEQPIYTGAYASGDLAAYSTSSGTAGVKPDFKRQVQVYDSLGNARSLTVAFLRTPGASTWTVEVYADPADVEATSNPNGLLASGAVTFNGNGALASGTITPTFPAGAAAGDPIGIDWLNSSGANDSSIDLSWGTVGNTDGLTQFSGESAVSFVTKDGVGFGELNSVRIDEDGFVEASFSNGEVRRIFQLPLATFANPAALSAQSGNVFAFTRESGDPTLQATGSGGAGTIAPGALEGANVDIADEFTKMIVTQRAYSANAKVITTTDDMLNELMQIKR